VHAANKCYLSLETNARREEVMIAQFRMKGHLDPSWQDWFAGLQIVQEPSGTTVLSGPLTDQAALFGVLLKINSLGLTLLSLETTEPALHQERVDMSIQEISTDQQGV
jgi:hypothetical protein